MSRRGNPTFRYPCNLHLTLLVNLARALQISCHSSGSHYLVHQYWGDDMLSKFWVYLQLKVSFKKTHPSLMSILPPRSCFQQWTREARLYGFAGVRSESFFGLRRLLFFISLLSLLPRPPVKTSGQVVPVTFKKHLIKRIILQLVDELTTGE